MLSKALVRIPPTSNGTGGTGFLIAPGTVVTCAHVLGHVVRGTHVTMFMSDGEQLDGRVIGTSAPPSDSVLWPLPDLAVLEFDVPGDRQCVWLTDDWPDIGDELYAVGFSRTLDNVHPNAEPALFRAEGEYPLGGGAVIQLTAQAHVMPGMSGAPVLNLASGRVCGAVKTSRDPDRPAGGWAVPIGLLGQMMAGVLDRHNDYHRRDNRWRAAAQRWTDLRTALFGRDRTPLALDDVRARPSVLLRADAAVAPFRGRTDLLAGLANWCDRPTAHSVDVRVLVGSGGTGKTRLAHELCLGVKARGWLAGFADRPEKDVVRQLLETAVPVLLVFDYAETRPDQIAELLEQLVYADRSEPTRLLLLARAAGEWWDELTTAGSTVEALLARVSPVAMPILEPTKDGRLRAYDEAVQAFADRLDLPASVPPLDLSDVRYGVPLDLQTQALAALLEAANPTGSGDVSADPIGYILNHERRYWRRTANERGLRPDAPVLDRVMAAATLCRADSETDAARLLAGVPDLAGPDPALRHRYARWAHEANPDRVHYLAPLQPDRLGEQLLIQVVSGTPSLLSGLLSTAENGQAEHALAVLLRLFRQLAYASTDDRRAAQFTDAVDNAFAARPDFVQRLAIERATARYAAELSRALVPGLRLFGQPSRRGSFDSQYVELRLASSSSANQTTLTAATAIHGRIIVRGAPGSGKSTSLLWLARRAVDRASRIRDDHLVPFYVPLRRYRHEPLPDPDRLLDESLSALTFDVIPVGWARMLFTTGRALMLVDGVDELPPELCDQVRDWLAEFVEAFPLARYVVATRPSLPPDWLTTADFESYDMLPMTHADTVRYVTCWYAGIESDAVMLQAIQSNPQLAQLASNPLFCALLCALWMSDRRLPTTQWQLYEDAINLFMTRWDAARSISTRRVGVETGLELLQNLAHWMLCRGEAESSRHAVYNLIRDTLCELQPTDTSPEEVLEHFDQRAGLLVRSNHDKYAFVHRAFRDYLAARHIANIGDFEYMISQAHRDEWRQVLIMAASRAIPVKQSQIVRLLLQRQAMLAADRRVRNKLILLAKTCVEQATSIDPSLRKEVLDAAREVDPD